MGFTRWLLRPRDKQVLRRAHIRRAPLMHTVCPCMHWCLVSCLQSYWSPPHRNAFRAPGTLWHKEANCRPPPRGGSDTEPGGEASAPQRPHAGLPQCEISISQVLAVECSKQLRSPGIITCEYSEGGRVFIDTA